LICAQFQQWDLEKEYGVYCANLAYGKHVLRKVIQKDKVNKDGRFEAFLHATTTLEKSQRQMLQDMLDAPRRRLQNYKLLLVAVRKFTDDRKRIYPSSPLPLSPYISLSPPSKSPSPLSHTCTPRVASSSASRTISLFSLFSLSLFSLSLPTTPNHAPYAPNPTLFSRIEIELPDAGHLDHAIQLLTGACHEVDKVVRDKGRDRIVAIQESIDMQHVYGNFDIVLDHLAHLSQLHPHPTCAV